MKRLESLFLLWLGVVFFLTSCTGLSGAKRERSVFSDQYPVSYSDWANAYLAGNGKMGVMVFGDPLNETIIFNDRGFNLAQAKERSFAQVSREDLDDIKSLCVAGRFAEANERAVKTAEWQSGGEGNRHPGYRMFIVSPENGTISRYSRRCDFRTGEITVKWTDHQGDWQRKLFVSGKDNVTVQLIEAPRAGKLTCAIGLEVIEEMGMPHRMNFSTAANGECINIRARYFPGKDAGYEGVTRFVVSGGSYEIAGGVLHVKEANSVLLLSRTAKYDTDCDAQWDKREIQQELKTLPADYETLFAGQLETHRKIYDRVALDLNASPEDRAKPTELLIEEQKASDAPVKALWERIFDAGRYYFLSSSSELTPPDLLGIWTGNCNAGWGGYYHLDSNLNLQVAAGNIGNMPEAMEGYFNINEVWAPDFRVNAGKLLGCRGLLACGNTPGLSSGLMASINDYYPYQYATGEEPWLLYPFWEHYLITGDTEFLRDRLYPLMKGMGYFYEDFLQYRDEGGKYIFAGSVSPENQPANLRVSLLNNSAFDVSGARFALGTLIEICRILDVEQGQGEGVERWTNLYERLPEYVINEDGAIKEWGWPGLDDNYHHRHWSQLLSVTPYQEITPEREPALYDAACRTLEIKDQARIGSGHFLLQGALIAANLKKPESVRHKLLRLTKEDFYFNSLATSHNPNHDIFCTDVCNSVPAILIEMLVGSSPGILEFLPALPAELTKGSLDGIRCRNRTTLKEFAWDRECHTIRCRIVSDVDQTVTLIHRAGIDAIETRAEVMPSALGGMAKEVVLKKGKETEITLITHPAK